MFTYLKRLFNKPQIGCLGGLVSPKDDRDIKHNIDTKLAGISNVPVSFTLSKNVGKILNQGQTNSCTGHAATYFMNVMLNKTLGTEKIDYKLNPFFNYYWARDFSGLLSSGDHGAYIRSTLSALQKKGVWCCNMSTTTQKPPEDFNSDNTFKLKGYEYITRTNDIINDLKYILSLEKLPILSCVNIIYDNIDTYTGEMKGSSLNSSGWHAMCIVGYETRKDGVWFHTANSWGSLNGDKGFAWIHEDYFKNTSLISELWCPSKTYF